MMDRTDIKRALAKHRAEESHGGGLGPYIHDIVYGANDGIVTTFAVVAGVTGADLASSIVIILGFANVFADALSMGLGNFLSGKSRQDNYQRLLKEERKEIEEIPEIEREEIREIYEAKGFKGADLDRVTEVITSDKSVWVDTMMREEHGLSPEEEGTPFLHGLMTFGAFILFGSIPIAPYLLPIADSARFLVTIGSTVFALLIVGLLRSWVTRERLIRGPLEIVSVGLVCAFVAYYIGVALKGFTGGAL
ncbi:MAG: VIT1/CCC1 transporter family protein [Candidatus Peribacteraceae bacterium]|nr:VIT1/CCC1 transporter family protein [Candidatus Peribacteraceae bacterium]MBP9850178.1 VIT1/CCC1 transporter family protein [Candidatus Peribacteraceae bacterium]